MAKEVDLSTRCSILKFLEKVNSKENKPTCSQQSLDGLIKLLEQENSNKAKDVGMKLIALSKEIRLAACA